MERLISLQAAIDAGLRLCGRDTKMELVNLCEASIADSEGRAGAILDYIGELEDLPSVQPEKVNEQIKKAVVDAIKNAEVLVAWDDGTDDDDLVDIAIRATKGSVIESIKELFSAQPEQRWIPCGKCIHADGKHRWCKILDRAINEDYFCYWAEPYREEGEQGEVD